MSWANIPGREMATERQIQFANKLMLRIHKEIFKDVASLTKEEASTFIDELQAEETAHTEPPLRPPEQSHLFETLRERYNEATNYFQSEMDTAMIVELDRVNRAMAHRRFEEEHARRSGRNLFDTGNHTHALQPLSEVQLQGITNQLRNEGLERTSLAVPVSRQIAHSLTMSDIRSVSELSHNQYVFPVVEWVVGDETSKFMADTTLRGLRDSRVHVRKITVQEHIETNGYVINVRYFSALGQQLTYGYVMTGELIRDLISDQSLLADFVTSKIVIPIIRDYSHTTNNESRGD